jgi:hypothetical protein
MKFAIFDRRLEMESRLLRIRQSAFEDQPWAVFQRSTRTYFNRLQPVEMWFSPEAQGGHNSVRALAPGWIPLFTGEAEFLILWDAKSHR